MNEETKQKLLEELRKEYRVELKPLPHEKLNVNDILNKYMDEICDKLNVVNDWKSRETIGNIIRRVVCFKYGHWGIKGIPYNQYESFRKDVEKFINEFILEKGTYNNEE